jgi:YfiH family protein
VKTADAAQSVRRVRETLDPRIPALVHPGWAASLPWVVQGTTTRGTKPDAFDQPLDAQFDAQFDLGLFSEGSSGEAVRANWSRLLAATGMRAALHARQVHGAEVRRHGDAGPKSASGLRIVGDCDGHATSEAGMLLAVSAADCVPIFVVDAAERTVAVLHAGWRGAAAGMLERGLEAVAGGAARSRLLVHLGPAICGRCYEVGPEVFEALGLAPPRGPELLDLRDALARRALAQGVSVTNLSVSEHCTRCTGSGLFSHRGGDRGRQVGYLGIRV